LQIVQTPLCQLQEVGVAHAGWQGILNGVIESFIEQFIERDLLIHFGAAISSKNLEWKQKSANNQQSLPHKSHLFHG
jgi:copper oxidase (laccase) domain-containing protein